MMTMSTTTTTMVKTTQTALEQAIHGSHRNATISKKRLTTLKQKPSKLEYTGIANCYYQTNFAHDKMCMWFKSQLRVNFHVKFKCECEWQTPENYYILMFKNEIETNCVHWRSATGACYREKKKQQPNQIHRIFFIISVYFLFCYYFYHSH